MVECTRLLRPPVTPARALACDREGAAVMTDHQKLKQVVDPEMRHRHERLERRWLVGIAVGTPLLLVLAMLLERVHFRNFTPGYDLSAVAIIVIACLCVVAGAALIVVGIRRGRSGLYPKSPGPGRWRSAIRTAQNRRVSGALLIAAGCVVALFSLTVLVMRFAAV